jgi:Kinesin motor domain
MMTRLPLPTAVLLRTSSTASSHEPSQISSPLSKQQVAQRTTSPSLSIVSSCRYTTRRYMISSETRREVRLHHINAIACSIVLCFLKCIQLYRKCARHPRECPWLWLEHRCARPRPLRVPRAREGRCHGELQHTRTPLTTDSRAGWLAALFNPTIKRPKYIINLIVFLQRLIRQGLQNRAIRSTDMNSESSRSHTILQLFLQVEDGDENGVTVLKRFVVIIIF